jgi:flagellar motor switch protein FliN
MPGWQLPVGILQRVFAVTERDGTQTGQINNASEKSEPRESQGRTGNWNIDLLLDVELPISVSFGNTEMQLKDVLKLGAGSVIELDKSVNDPVTIIVNHKPIAKGEVVMVEGNYGVRILQVESTADRIRSLG